MHVTLLNILYQSGAWMEAVFCPVLRSLCVYLFERCVTAMTPKRHHGNFK
jgi:hypothetical protein